MLVRLHALGRCNASDDAEAEECICARMYHTASVRAPQLTSVNLGAGNSHKQLCMVFGRALFECAWPQGT
jgi:hypothetical protein